MGAGDYTLIFYSTRTVDTGLRHTMCTQLFVQIGPLNQVGTVATLTLYNAIFNAS